MNPERILVRGVNWLGDAVMTTPALRRLREARAAAHISLLTPEKLGDLWLNHPAIDAVLSFSPKESVWHIARQLREQRFDLGLILPNSPRSALELWLARVPRRIGYATRWRGVFLTDRVAQRPHAQPMRKRRVAEIRRLAAGGVASTGRPLPPGGPAPQRPEPAEGAAPGDHAFRSHHIYHYLNLVGALGAQTDPLPPLLNVPASEAQAVGRKLGLVTDPPDPRPLLGLNPGAEYGPAKRWPPERFVAAALEVQRRLNCRWVIFGGPRDLELAETIAAQITERESPIPNAPSRPPARSASVVNLAGRTSLRQLCAALRLCRLLLTNDTGPMHVAAAVGTPVVALFGSTASALTGPGLPGDGPHRLLLGQAPCAPCFRRDCPIDLRCLNSLRVERVVEAVLELMGGGS